MIVLGIDALLILFPPFQVAGRLDLGNHWLFFKSPYGTNVTRINFTTLAAEIAIVSIVGFTVFVLVREIGDGRATAVLDRQPALGRAFSKIAFWSALVLAGALWAVVLWALVGGLDDFVSAWFTRAQP